MSIRSRIFAATYDRQMKKVEQGLLGRLRTSVLSGATGDVLEIGGGTGANIEAYPDTITSLTITEPEAPMLRRLQQRRPRTGTSPRCGPRRRTSRSKTEHSTRSSPHSCYVGSTTSNERCARLPACCGPAGDCCSSSTSARTT